MTTSPVMTIRLMRLSLLSLPVLFLTAALPAAGQQRQSDNSFTWTGRVSPGRWVRIRNLSGAITVGQASGDNVEVTATKRWRRGDPSVVHFETKKFGPGDESVLICALWGERSSCTEDSYHVRGDREDRGMRNNDVIVDFRVLLPRGVRIGANNVNGDVSIDGATADVDAGTVNGEVDVASAGGRVNATNVNGNVRARLGKLDSDGRMEFTTVNGSVIVEFSGDTGADVDMQTVNGSLNTNFEMTLSGRIDPKRIRTHIGRPGGPRIKLETVNGSVDLRRRS
jgi:hypothetical protein